MLGTPHYMSPEHIQRFRDLWRSGPVLPGRGRVPVPGRPRPVRTQATAYELLKQTRCGAATPLSELRRDLSPNAYAAIDRALAKRSEDRFASVTDFVNALAGRVQQVAPRRAVRRRRVVGWGAGLAAAAVTLYAGTTLLHRGAGAQDARVGATLDGR